MKKSKLIKLEQAIILILFIGVYSCCCPCYMEKTFTNVANVRTQTIALINSSTDSIKNHRTEIIQTGKTIDNAINDNKGRKGCKEIGKIWKHLKTDSTGVYDRFLMDWTKHITLPTVYSKSISEDVNKILDEINDGEKAIKEKKKPCK
jgi:hypothetical protein